MVLNFTEAMWFLFKLKGVFIPKLWSFILAKKFQYFVSKSDLSLIFAKRPENFKELLSDLKWS